MGFHEERARLLEALFAAREDGALPSYDPRDLDDNLLVSGELLLVDLIEIVKRSSGLNYQGAGEHHQKPGVQVHVIKDVKYQGTMWYIKWYFDDPELWFISAHPSREG